MSPTLQHKKSHRTKGTTHPAQSPIAETVVPARYFAWKYPSGQVLALLLLVPAIPLILILVAVVRLTSSGPGIFRQIRVGRHGRTFLMYKIRTMRQDAERGTGPVWAKPGDHRVTRVGFVLRKLHLDELPQLLNVLKGEMALIGPRPERPEFTQHLAREIPRYLERLSVLPGITGLAQINLPPDTDLDSVRRKLILDLDYIQNAGLTLDLRMFLCTALRLVGVQGERAMRLCGVRRPVGTLNANVFFSSATNGGQEAVREAPTGQSVNGHANDDALVGEVAASETA